jgi:nitrogen regulatory protein PII
MKLLIAIIRENQLDQVREALVNAGISRITVSHVSGHGRTHVEEIYRGQKVVPNLVPNVAFVKPACDAILTATKANDSGLIGSGKIFIVPLEECIRLRTGEHGSEAI